MSKFLVIPLAIALAIPLFGQTTNVAGSNQVLIEGEGAGATSPAFAVNSNENATLDIAFDAVPNAQFIMVVSDACVPGAIPLAGGFSVDFDFASAIFLLDGTGLLTNSGFLTPFLTTGAAGDASLALPNFDTTERCVQFAFVSPSFPNGLGTSAATQLTYGDAGSFLAANGLSSSFTATPLALTDDGSVQVNLPGFRFYGTFYFECFVNMNGNITFTSGDTDFSESLSEFLSDRPRIACWWDDFNPSAGGTVTFFTNNIGISGVQWTDVPQFGTADANSFRVFFTNADVQISYGNNMPTDGLVGLSPGGNIDPVGTALDLSNGVGAIPGGARAYYELFTPSNPGDFRYGTTIAWALDGSGNPI